MKVHAMKVLKREPGDLLAVDEIDDLNTAIKRAANELFITVQKYQDKGVLDSDHWEMVLEVLTDNVYRSIRQTD